MIEFIVILFLLITYSVYIHQEEFKANLSILTIRKNSKEILKKIFKSKKRTLLTGFVEVLFFILLVYLAFTMKIFFVAVLSNSMYPTFERGDIVLVQSIFKDPKEGDIVVFIDKKEGYSVTHRVLRIRGDKIYTGGDLSGPDERPITKNEIIGKAIIIFGHPIVIKGVGNYFILNVKEMREITPYGEEYLVYKKIIDVMRHYAIAVIIIGISSYIFIVIRESR